MRAGGPVAEFAGGMNRVAFFSLLPELLRIHTYVTSRSSHKASRSRAVAKAERSSGSASILPAASFP